MMEVKCDCTETKVLKKYRNLYPSKHGCIIHLNPEAVYCMFPLDRTVVKYYFSLF